MLDTTDGIPGPYAIGFVDPAMQTGSDPETSPVSADEYVHVRDRFDRNVIFRSAEGLFVAAAPVGSGYFDGVDEKVHTRFEDAVATFREHAAIEAAKAYQADVKARCYRGAVA